MSDARQLTLFPERVVSPENYDVPLASLPADSNLPGPAPTSVFLDNIKKYGILSPIILIKKGHTFQIADGRCRILSARKLKLKFVPARIYPDGWAMQEVLGLIANEMRRDNPYSDLNAIEHLSQRGFSEQEICDATGMPVVTLRKRMRLCNLFPAIKKAFIAGRVPVSVAESAATLNKEEQTRLAEKLNGDAQIKLSDIKELKTAALQQMLEKMPGLDLGEPQSASKLPADKEEESLEQLKNKIVLLERENNNLMRENKNLLQQVSLIINEKNEEELQSGQKDRIKVLNAGFRIFRLEQVRKKIREMTPAGNWKDYGSPYSSKKAANEALRLLLENDRCIQG
ncbi:MAG: ParB N-terminal domain-containing protein [Gammaproteobacteria bacterium]|nr:ParB N-terminal domain-containing protein [Gammaproteobacteria bacterium]